mmetsp:Transcript_81771/g.236262  ORF Transcript_81771/g.236262 Transcript_81771/m.236262 type:complete len:200 (-) Transcript_81771:924-1523(-)
MCSYASPPSWGRRRALGSAPLARPRRPGPASAPPVAPTAMPRRASTPCFAPPTPLPAALGPRPRQRRPRSRRPWSLGCAVRPWRRRSSTPPQVVAPARRGASRKHCSSPSALLPGTYPTTRCFRRRGPLLHGTFCPRNGSINWRTLGRSAAGASGPSSSAMSSTRTWRSPSRFAGSRIRRGRASCGTRSRPWRRSAAAT